MTEAPLDNKELLEREPVPTLAPEPEPEPELESEPELEQEACVSRTNHLLLAAGIFFCCAFLAWAWFGKLDIVSMAEGKVAPSSRVKEVQHLEGGIVAEILVQEGSRVKVDQPLLVLEGTSSDASVRELEVRTVALRVDIARLKAIQEDLPKPLYPPELAASHANLISQSEDLFNLQLTKYRSDLASREEVIKQRTEEIKGVESRITNNFASLELLHKQTSISAELLKEQLTTEYKHLGFLREESSLKSKIEEDQSLLKRIRSQLEEAQENLRKARFDLRERTGGELKMVRQELDELTQRLKKYQDSQRRSIIRSPVDGIIKTMYLNTTGGVVTPGQIVLTIVPTDDTLIVEAHLPIQDIGYVKAGQVAVIKLASRDARRFGNLPGQVVSVSPDAMVLPDGRTFYAVRIKTERDYFAWRTERYQLVPGMQVVAYIHTGQRTLLEYLLDPYVDSMGQAMQER